MDTERDERLISRLVGGDAGEADWAEFRGVARVRPALWRELAEAQQDQAHLALRIEEAVVLADGVDLPRPRRSRSVAGWIGSWAGWAVAAGLLLTVALRGGPAAPTPVDPAPVATPVAVDLTQLPPDHIRSAYVNSVRGAENPTKTLLDVRPSADGQGYDLIYLRSFLERTHVDDLYELGGEDERGRPTLVRYQPPVRSAF